MRDSSEELRDLYNEALAELVEGGADPDDEETQWAAQENATQDLTYTESGYLTSYEWGIELRDPTRAELLEFCGTFDAHYVNALHQCERAPGDKLATRRPGSPPSGQSPCLYLFR